MTREEVGVELVEAVKTVGRILSIQNQYSSAVHRSRKDEMASLLSQRDELKAQLHKQMEVLSDADAAEIVRKHPWVMQ